ncbi:hypothetical protein [Sanguibacter suarezii]|uniref:hypothetical protein n=1 Tax=Sanguibacter suarezii TaxID=60921 RepID=UPI00082BB7CC|nr:hypothetical protein [Sanguibacter suarezii]
MTSNAGGSGPAFIPSYIPEPEVTDEKEREADMQATPEQIKEEEEVVERLDDPDVEAAIEHLRETRDEAG